jgi:hypothetical protein
MVRMQDLPLDLETFRSSRVSDYRRGGEQFVNAIRIVGFDRAARAVGAHIYSAHGVEWIILEQAETDEQPVFECLWFHDACERAATLAGAEERLYHHIAQSDDKIGDAPALNA